MGMGVRNTSSMAVCGYVLLASRRVQRLHWLAGGQADTNSNCWRKVGTAESFDRVIELFKPSSKPVRLLNLISNTA